MRRTVPALIGYHVATWIVTAAVGLGVGLTLLRNPTVARILGVLGACYVLWLGGRSLVAAWRSRGAGAADAGQAPEAPVRLPGLWAGVWLLLLNPKAYVIISAMFAAFLTPGASSTWDVVWITTIFTVNNLIAFALWAAFGQALSRAVSTNAQRVRLDQVFGLGLVGVGSWLLVGAL